jgi:protein SCO1/2/putative membrane protein
MKGLQDRLASANVLLVSISVDPDHDTPPVLREYAERFGALPDRWWFLTGAKPAIQALVTRDFKLALTETTPSDGVEAFTHSDRLALVDGDRVVGFFETGDETALEDLVVRARRLGLPQWVRGLPAVNASLNALCAVLLVNGWLLIRRKESRLALGAWSSADSASSSTSLLGPVGARAHGLCMLLAVATSALFLGCYLVYHYYAGSVPFPHPGARRWLYLSILLSHTLLATFGVVPLVLFTLYRALKGQYRKHASIAQITFPVWLYVSVTGVVIYLMLYHWPVASVTG